MREVTITVQFKGSEEDGEEVIELLRFIAEQMKLKNETTKEISEDE